MTDRTLPSANAILSIAEAAGLTPWGLSTLYREAAKDDSPFRKRGGRWVVVYEDLVAWTRSGSKPQTRDVPSESPMPRPRRKDRGRFEARVIELRRNAA
jgi:hypothetical protein